QDGAAHVLEQEETAAWPRSGVRSGHMIANRGPRSAEERGARRDLYAGDLRARGQADRAAADVDLRGLRILRAARAGRVRRPVANALPRVPRAGVRRRRVPHARDTLFADPVA